MNDFRVGGFRFVGIHCGVKKSGKPDIGMIVAHKPVPCAGVFTTNQIVAAPVVQSRTKLARSARAQAVVINSGNANACTGNQGEHDAHQMAELSALALGCTADDVQVCSTGVIGAPLPMAAIDAGIKSAAKLLSDDALTDFAEAIRTTDTFPKIRGAKIIAGGRTFTVAGVSKGAGMIHPNMATMLGVMVTDAPILGTDIGPMWRRICAHTFNAITIDGDTSTNDTALFMASGAEGGSDLSEAELVEFEAQLLTLTAELAKDIVRDAEGGTKVVEVRICGAVDVNEARLTANTIALSPLVKTAIHGQDPNWGRIIAAAGRSGARLDPDSLSLRFNNINLYENGEWLGTDAEKRACEVMAQEEYTITLDLGVGKATHGVYTCDFSADYVRINADYRS
jgi:glutamate N-acetyltransferase/amino-acid N-acetyltransferase